MIKSILTMSAFMAATGAALLACGGGSTADDTFTNPDGSTKGDGATRADGSKEDDGAARADATAKDGGSSNTDASAQDGSAADDGATGQADGSGAADGPELEAGACTYAPGVGEAGLTENPCAVARDFVVCTFDSGASCDCVSNDPTSCGECGIADAASTCKSMCAPNEYAVACGGPPGPTYEMAPAACHSSAVAPGGRDYSCCPCQ